MSQGRDLLGAIVEDVSDTLGPTKAVELFHDGSFEHTVRFTCAAGDIAIETLHMDRDLGFIVCRHGPLAGGFRAKSYVRHPLVKFLFPVADPHGLLLRLDGVKRPYTWAPGRQYCASRSARGMFEQPSDQSNFYVNLLCGSPRLRPFCEEYTGKLPESVRSIVEEPQDEPRAFPASFGSDTAMVLRQIVGCRLMGSVKALFMEAKALELLSLSLETMMRNAGRERGRETLCRRDLEALHALKDILDSDFRSPQTLTALARRAGISTAKLKRAFPAVFGMPPHRYVMERRLETVVRLLGEGACNVKEAAFIVGYRSQSHFASVFRKRYGVHPTDCLRGIRPTTPPN